MKRRLRASALLGPRPAVFVKVFTDRIGRGRLVLVFLLDCFFECAGDRSIS